MRAFAGQVLNHRAMNYYGVSTAYLQHYVVGNYDDQGSCLGELELFPTQLIGVTAARSIPLEQTDTCKKLSQHIQV